MSAPLYLVQLRLDPLRFIRFAQDQGINVSTDADLGYCTHAWLAALLGPMALKPFRVFGAGIVRKDRPLQLLGYSHQDGATLHEQAAAFALPLTSAVCAISDLRAAKPMPTQWTTGRRLGFDILTCPVSRAETEKDVFLRCVEQADVSSPPLERETVYAEWLARQFATAATCESVALTGFRHMRVLRRAKADQTRRFYPSLVLPQALLRGVLVMQNGAAFNAALLRGIGRHRAFGYGMLLLKPPNMRE